MLAGADLIRADAAGLDLDSDRLGEGGAVASPDGDIDTEPGAGWRKLRLDRVPALGQLGGEQALGHAVLGALTHPANSSVTTGIRHCLAILLSSRNAKPT